MNERIFELAKQAGFLEEDGGDNLHVFDGYEAITCTEELKKFAELIVRECARAVNKVYEDAEPDHGWPDWATFAPQGSDVLKHFGFKE
jgi:hypothetical protein